MEWWDIVSFDWKRQYLEPAGTWRGKQRSERQRVVFLKVGGKHHKHKKLTYKKHLKENPKHNTLLYFTP